LTLDLDYIRNTWAPEAVRRYFGGDDTSDYDVRIVWADSGGVIYDSSSKPAAWTRTDAEAGMFDPRPGAMGMLRSFGGPPRAAGPGGPPAAGRWRLQVRGRLGSVENSASKSRMRNIAVSAGVLLIMAAAIAALLAAMRKADALAMQQMQFVAAVSHELRTPLAVIRSAAENLADGVVKDPEPVKEYGALIREEGRRLSYLVEHTLRFAGIQTRKARYNLVAVDAAAVIKDAMQSCEGILRTSGCRVDMQIEPGLPKMLADPSSIAVSVGNLLTNAARHGKSGGWIGVRASNGNGTVKIAVVDRGPGISQRDLAHIFEPFYRGKQAEADQVSGTGLGLALVQQIVTAHNGEVTVESKVGEGSRFTITLPAATGVDTGPA
jgi:signal transduction histidine kinase